MSTLPSSRSISSEDPPPAVPPASELPVKRKTTNLPLLAGQLILSVLLIVLAFSQVTLDELVARLAKVSPGTIGLFFALIGLQLLLLAQRWGLIVQALGSRAPTMTLVIGTLGERLVNQVLPSTLGGDAMRVVQLLSAGVPRRPTLLSILADRGAGILGMFLLCAALAPIGLALGIANDVMIWSLVLGAIALVAVACVLLMAKLSASSALPTKLNRLTPYAVDGLRLARTPQFLLAAGPFSMGIQLIFCIIYVALAHDIAPEVDLFTVVFLAPVILLSAAVPITVNGWGLRETAAIALFGGIGANSEAAMSISVAFGLLQLLMGLTCGVLLVVALLSKRLLAKSGA